MSTDLSQEFAEDALGMLADDGVTVTVLARVKGAMTAAGDRADTTLPRTAAGLIFPTRGTVLVEGQERASERVIMAPVEPWPAPGERLVINGRHLTIGDDGVKTYAPQGLAIIHDIAVAS